MKKCLKKENFEIYHILKGKKINGVSGIWGDVFGIWGDVSGIRGDVFGIWGDVSGIRGDVSGIWGDVSGIRGDVSGIWGDVDDAELTDDERRAGIDVSQLLKDKN